MAFRDAGAHSPSALNAMDSTPDLPAIKSSAALGGGAAGSKHMSALRSLGLLHELKDYMESLEATAAEQKKQLRKLQEEKRQQEKVLPRDLRTPGRLAASQQFEVSETMELPPRLRALVEDNKVLREEARRYKARAHDLERAGAASDARCQSLQEQVRTLAAAAQGALSPAEQRQMEAELEEKCAAVARLEHKVAVLNQKLETDARSHRQALTTAAKEHAALEQQLDKLTQQLEERDKEARAAVLAAKQAARKLEETAAAAKRQAAAAAGRTSEAVAAAVAAHRLEARKHVHLMLCLIRAPCPGPAKPQRNYQELLAQAQAAAQLQQQGISVSAGPRRYSPEQAAVKIQSALRGHRARQLAAEERARQQRAAVVLQAGARGMQARRHVRELQQQQQQQQQQQAAEPLRGVAGSAPDTQAARCSTSSAASARGGGGGGGGSRAPTAARADAAAARSAASSCSSNAASAGARGAAAAAGGRPLERVVAGGGGGGRNSSSSSSSSASRRLLRPSAGDLGQQPPAGVAPGGRNPRSRQVAAPPQGSSSGPAAVRAAAGASGGVAAAAGRQRPQA